MKQQKLSDGDHQAMPLVIFCASGMFFTDSPNHDILEGLLL